MSSLVCHNDSAVSIAQLRGQVICSFRRLLKMLYFKMERAWARARRPGSCSWARTDIIIWKAHPDNEPLVPQAQAFYCPLPYNPLSTCQIFLPLISAPTGFHDLGLVTRWAGLANRYLPSTPKDRSTMRAEVTEKL